jgi:predicted nucleic acid-binding protein
MKAVFDTNILIDYLLGKEAASDVIKQYEDPQISIITKMEILVGSDNSTEEVIRHC